MDELCMFVLLAWALGLGAWLVSKVIRGPPQ